MSRVLVSASSHRYDNTATGIVTAFPFTLYGYFKFTGSKPTTGFPTFMGPMLDFDSFAVIRYRGQSSQDTLDARQEDGSGASSERTMASVAADTWFAGAAVFASATSRTIYVNSTAGTTDTTNLALPAVNRFHVGALWNSGSYAGYIDGEVADVGLVPAAATSGEIADFASGISGQVVWPAGAYGSRNGERAHWDFFGDTGPNETDVINSIVLTANGTPAQGTHPTLDYGGGGGSPVGAGRGMAPGLVPGIGRGMARSAAGLFVPRPKRLWFPGLSLPALPA